jgi:phage repressor protein C with HTH and peptisase S24 domain
MMKFMSTPIDRLRQAMRQRQVLSGAELARRSGQNDVTVRSHLNGTRAISRKAAEAYCKALRIDPAWLLYGTGGDLSQIDADQQAGPDGASAKFFGALGHLGMEEAQSEEYLHADNLRPAGLTLPNLRALGRDVPVLGTAECGEYGAFTLNSGDPIDFVRRPPGIANRKGVYCIYAEGASMEPAYEAGDLVFADPHRPPRAGRDVVVQLRSKSDESEPRCFLKRLVRRQNGKWLLRQFNPPQEMALAERDVVAVHLVLKNHELLGL